MEAGRALEDLGIAGSHRGSPMEIKPYKADSRYVANAEGGVRWNDPDLAIPWPIQHPIISTKDAAWGLLRHFVTPFE